MLKKSREPDQLQLAEDVSLFEAIIKTLLYFDIFHYPLTREEIFSFLGRTCDRDELRASLKKLVQANIIFQFNEYFSVQNESGLVVRRVKGNELADKMLKIARHKAKLIGKFPFVRSVFASGSLSKGYMDETSDIDYFIITKPQRLWIARMLLVMYKRIFLLNSHKHFCVNYFISSDNLEIEEKNQFTATELATVLPLYGHAFYHELLFHNEWLTRFYPNYQPRVTSTHGERKSHLKDTLERMIDLIGGQWLDAWCMRRHQKWWIDKYRHQYNDADFQIAFKSKKNASKNHPKHFQKKVIDQLELKWQTFKGQHRLDAL